MLDVSGDISNFTHVVRSTLLDDYCERLNLTKVNFIKMDIEAAEPETLLGAAEINKCYRPKLAISIYHDFNHFYQISKIIKELVPEYRLYLKHNTIHEWETVLFATI